jgi:hypothetical protein
MAAFVTGLLCVLIIIRPQDFVQELARVPVVHLLCGLTFLSIVLDVSRRRIRLLMPPQIPVFLAFLAWALLVALFKRPDTFTTVLGSLGILSCIFLLVAIGFGTTGGIKLFAPVFLGCGLFIACVAISQYVSPFECFRGDVDDWEGAGVFFPDGRPCEFAYECRTEDSNDKYLCERGGFLNTRTVAGRVRYLGHLEDPNEVALLLSLTLPFGLALTEVPRRGGAGERPTPRPLRSPAARSPAPGSGGMGAKRVQNRRLLTLMLVGLVGFIVAITRSRTGVVVFLLVMGIYLVRRIGARGVLLICVVAPPMLLFGGRSGSDADASAHDRTEVLLEAFQILAKTKGIGAGVGRFVDESAVSRTAHNAYLLAAGETGIVGVLLFGTFLYVCIKVPVALWFGRYRISPTTARMAPALAISLCGVAVGIVFLSWTYDPVLYLLASVSCALYIVAKAEDPRIDLRLSGREMVLVPCGVMALLIAFYTGARLRM